MCVISSPTIAAFKLKEKKEKKGIFTPTFIFLEDFNLSGILMVGPDAQAWWSLGLPEGDQEGKVETV